MCYPTIHRREFLRRASGWSLGLFGAALGLDPLARALAQTGRYDGRLIDTHAHVYWDEYADAQRVVQVLEQAGVDGLWLHSVPWNLAADAAALYPARLVPFLGEGYADAVASHSAYVNPDGLEALLAAGVVRGLGEIILRHSAFRLGAEGGFASAPANNIPADHPRLIEAFRLAGKYGVPVTVHQEWFFGEELGRAVEAAPETAFVWAHAGHGPAAAVADMLARYPNLHADLSARTPWIGPGTVLLRPGGELDPAWRTTLERFPDRFTIGLDLFAPAHYRVEYARMLAEYYRRLLGTLPFDIAELVAFRNAERLAPFQQT
jgi:hypothetical protein